MIKYIDYPMWPMSDTVNAHLLAASTAESDTIPTTANYVIMTSSLIAYFRFGATATIPADTTDGSASETLPAGIPVIRAIPKPRTNGWITTGTAALTVDSAEGLTIGNSITVVGAGAAGVDLTTTISAINQTTKVVTLGASASTTVAGAVVTSIATTISFIAAGTPIVTLSYYK